MTELLIRNISDAVITQLKLKAQADGVSVEEEARRVLEAGLGAGATPAEQLDKVLAKIGERPEISVVDLIRQQRDAR